jgi:hypothetical protein
MGFCFGPGRREREIAGIAGKGQGAGAHVREGGTVGEVSQQSGHDRAAALAALLRDECIVTGVQRFRK